MSLELTDEQTELRDTVHRFVAEKASVAGYVRPLLSDPRGVTDAVWRGLSDLGTTGLLVPPEYGGAGMTMVEVGIVLEELGAALDPGPWRSTAVDAARALTRCGAPGALFAGIADGSTIATLGSLRPVKWGDGPRLSGEMSDVPDVAAADVLLVLAEHHDGTTLFAVDTSAAGVVVTAQPGIDQTSKVFSVTLDGAPAERLGAASADAIEALRDDVLIARAADALGAARAVMDLTVEYAKTRRQFGQLIGSFQAVQHLCVDMFETVELARGGVMHALWAADAADPAERHLAAIRAKAFAGRLATVADMAIQVLGGIGYTWEHDAQLYLKRLLSWNAFLGGPDRYFEQVGKQLVRSRT